MDMNPKGSIFNDEIERWISEKRAGSWSTVIQSYACRTIFSKTNDLVLAMCPISC